MCSYTSSEKNPTALAVHIFAFGCFGFLVGNLIGFTAESVVKSLIPLLFAFGGGSAIAFMGKLTEMEQVRASVAIGFFSLSCLLGTYTSILLVEHQIFTPERVINSDREGITKITDRKLLRSTILSASSSIDQRVRSGLINHEEAYRELQHAINAAK